MSWITHLLDKLENRIYGIIYLIDKLCGIKNEDCISAWDQYMLSLERKEDAYDKDLYEAREKCERLYYGRDYGDCDAMARRSDEFEKMFNIALEETRPFKKYDSLLPRNPFHSR